MATNTAVLVKQESPVIAHDDTSHEEKMVVNEAAIEGSEQGMKGIEKVPNVDGGKPLGSVAGEVMIGLGDENNGSLEVKMELVENTALKKSRLDQ